MSWQDELVGVLRRRALSRCLRHRPHCRQLILVMPTYIGGTGTPRRQAGTSRLSSARRRRAPDAATPRAVPPPTPTPRPVPFHRAPSPPRLRSTRSRGVGAPVPGAVHVRTSSGRRRTAPVVGVEESRRRSTAVVGTPPVRHGRRRTPVQRAARSTGTGSTRAEPCERPHACSGRTQTRGPDQSGFKTGRFLFNGATGANWEDTSI